MLLRDRCWCLTRKRKPCRKELVKNHTHCIDIGSKTRRAASTNFRCKVGNHVGCHRHAGRSAATVALPKSTHLESCAAVGLDDDIVAPDVAMNDAFRVKGVEPL